MIMSAQLRDKGVLITDYCKRIDDNKAVMADQDNLAEQHILIIARQDQHINAHADTIGDHLQTIANNDQTIREQDTTIKEHV
jgi:hypothetical protein